MNRQHEKLHSGALILAGTFQLSVMYRAFGLMLKTGDRLCVCLTFTSNQLFGCEQQNIMLQHRLSSKSNCKYLNLMRTILEVYVMC